MSHNFLLSTYDHIARRLAEVEPDLTREGADDETRQYAAGQIDVLCEFERFLGEHFDIKLPRRLRRRREESPAICTGLEPKDRT